MHRIVLQNNLFELGTGIPAIDNVAYGQIIDEESPQAVDDKRIPEELKDLASEFNNLAIEPEVPDIVGDFLAELGGKE